MEGLQSVESVVPSKTANRIIHTLWVFPAFFFHGLYVVIESFWLRLG